MFCTIWLLNAPVQVVEATSGLSASEIDSYLAGKGSPLAGQGSAFIRHGETFNVDPRLIVAIAGAESSFGRNGSCATQYYNAWGYGGGWPDCWEFANWERGIHQVSAAIGNTYLPVKSTIADLSNGVYPSYCGSGCEHWIPNVRQFYAEQGGDPNTNDLTYQGNIAPRCSNNAVFVAQSTFPTIQPGEQFQIFFEVRNTGTCTWRNSDGYNLLNVNEWALGANRTQTLPHDVAPNQTVRLNMTMYMPDGLYEPGRELKTQWSLAQNGQYFGPWMHILVTVGDDNDTSQCNTGYFLTNYNVEATAGVPEAMLLRVRNSSNCNWDANKTRLHLSGDLGNYEFVLTEPDIVWSGGVAEWTINLNSRESDAGKAFDVIWTVNYDGSYVDSDSMRIEIVAPDSGGDSGSSPPPPPPPDDPPPPPPPVEYELHYRNIGARNACGVTSPTQGIIQIDTLAFGENIVVGVSKCNGGAFSSSGRYYIRIDNVRRYGPYYYDRNITQHSDTISPPESIGLGTHEYQIELYPTGQDYPIWSGAVLIRGEWVEQ